MGREENVDPLGAATLFAESESQPLLSGDDCPHPAGGGGSETAGNTLPSVLGYPTQIQQFDLSDTESRKAPFRHGLFECFGDMNTCGCCGFWCTCCLYGINVQTMQVMRWLVALKKSIA